jgi:hypothetical protein
MEMENKKLPFWEIIKTLTIFILAIGVIIGVSKLISFLFIEKGNTEYPIVESNVTCPADFSSYEKISQSKRLEIISNKPSNGTDGVLKGYKVTLERTGLTSNIACGYLMYQVSYDGKPIEQSSMDLFMRPTYSQLGGHLLPDENKRSIIKEVDGKTQILMPLDSIIYDGLSRNIIKEANWSSLLNVTDTMEFEIALSANNEKGNLDLVEIAYKCINKETGKETDTCSLKVVGIEPFGF